VVNTAAASATFSVRGTAGAAPASAITKTKYAKLSWVWTTKLPAATQGSNARSDPRIRSAVNHSNAQNGSSSACCCLASISAGPPKLTISTAVAAITAMTPRRPNSRRLVNHTATTASTLTNATPSADPM